MRQRYPFSLYAYVLMSNHFHLVAVQYGGYLIGDRGLMASHSHYTSVISAFRSPAGSGANTPASAA